MSRIFGTTKRRGFSTPTPARTCIVCDRPIYKDEPTEFGSHGSRIGLRHEGCQADGPV